MSIYNIQMHICKPSRSSPIQTYINVRRQLEMTYGAAWFIKMSFKGILLQEFVRYANPNYLWHPDWASMIRTIQKIDEDNNDNVSVSEITKFVKKPYKIKINDKRKNNGDNELFRFPECE